MNFFPIWSIAAISAPISWIGCNIIDKFVFTRAKLNPWIYLGLGGIVGMILVSLFMFLKRIPLQLPADVLFLSLASGAIIGLFNILYLYAIGIGDIVIVATLLQTTALFSIIWGRLILHETYNISSYLGMALIFIGAVIASFSEDIRSLSINRLESKTFIASLLIILATFSLSLANLMQDVALQRGQVYAIFFWQKPPLFVFSIILLIVKRKEFKKMAGNVVTLGSLSEAFNQLGFYLLTLALSTGPLIMVSFLTSIQPVWAIIITSIIRLIYPGTFLETEHISRSRSIFACIMILLGLYLIRVSYGFS